MFSTIEQNLKLLDDDSQSFNNKLQAYESAKKDLEKITSLFEALNNPPKDNKNEINYSNIDEKLSAISENINKIKTGDMSKSTFDMIINLKADILQTKKFLDTANHIKIQVKQNNKLNDITKNIKDNILINQSMENKDDKNDQVSDDEKNNATDDDESDIDATDLADKKAKVDDSDDDDHSNVSTES